MSVPEISIIIVSWNAREYLVNCLESIEKTTADVDHEILVVDNASSDGSPEAVSQGFPQVKLINTGRNLGFAKANNVGMDQSSGRFICLVNSDVVVHEGCFQALLAFMREHPRAGLVGPRLLNGDGSLQASCRSFPTLWNHLGRALFVNTSLANAAYRGDQEQKVEVVAGAFILARREAIQQVGKFDESFFFYGEDMDWSRRMARGGWDVMYHPQAQAIHFGGGSSSAEPARFCRELHKAQLLLWRKHYGPVLAGFYLLISLLHSAFRLSVYGLTYVARPDHRTRAKDKISQHWQTVGWILRPAR